MKLFVFITVLFLSGCFSLHQLKPPKKNLYFTLNEDRVTFFDAGMGYRQARGLLKGSYEIVGENQKGYFFFPIDGQGVFLVDKLAENFEKTGIYPPNIKGAMKVGIWFSKSETGSPYDLFQIITHNYDAIGGAVHAGMAKMMEGKAILLDVPYLPDFSDVQFNTNNDEQSNKNISL